MKDNRMIPIRLSAAVVMLSLVACAHEESSKGSGIPNEYPYELTISMTVDGQPLTLDRVGACSHEVKSGPTGGYVKSVSYWDDGLPGSAVATVLPNKEAVVVQLPDLCPGNISKQGKWEAPLLVLPENYRPGVIWIRDVENIDGFELYPSIQPDPNIPLHVRVTSMKLSPLEGAKHVTAPTDAEWHLARRFGWGGLGDSQAAPKKYRDYVAFVLPKTFWSRDPVLDAFYSDKKDLFVYDGDDKAFRTVDTHYILLINFVEAAQWGVPPLIGAYNANQGPYYEIPIVQEGSDWVLQPQSRGIRVYKEVLDYNQVSATQKWSVPYDELTYKGTKIKPGDRLFDPESQQIIDILGLDIDR